MRNFLDDAPVRSIDSEFDYDDDATIEMVLSESAMHLLSQAAASPTEPARPAPNPVVKAPGVVAAETPAAKVAIAAVPAGGAPVAKAPAADPSAGGPLAPEVPAVAVPAPEAPVAKIPAAAVPVVEAPIAKVPVAAVPAPEAMVASARLPRPPMSTLRFAIVLGVVAVASALVTAITYVATTDTPQLAPISTTIVFSPPAPVVVAPPALPPPPPAPSADPAPVRYANPFDKKEVFEFPAGTSQADARDAVAEILYERAQERGVPARGIVSGMSARHTTSATAAATPAARKAAP